MIATELCRGKALGAVDFGRFRRRCATSRRLCSATSCRSTCWPPPAPPAWRFASAIGSSPLRPRERGRRWSSRPGHGSVCRTNSPASAFASTWAGPADSSLVLEHVLSLHEPRLSHASSGIGGALALDELPPDARRAALELKRMAAAARQAGGSWYRRALAAGTVSLDLRDPGQLDLLRRFGPYSTDARVWVEDDPEPVIESAESLDGQPRVSYRLEAGEFDRLRTALAAAGLVEATLVPRRSRVRVGH